MVTQETADLSKEVLTPRELDEVVNNEDKKKDCNFLETLLVAFPLLGWGFQLGK